MAVPPNLNATEIAKLRAEGYCFQIIDPSRHKFPIGLTLYQIFVLVGGTCGLVAIVNIILVWLSHLRWRSSLPQQKQLMRILPLPIIFAICSWSSIYEYRLNSYLIAIPKVCETYAIACFYQFMLQVLTNTEDEHKREQFMVEAERQTRRKHHCIHDKGSLRWYKVRSMVVFQAPLITLLGVIAVEIIASVVCSTTRSAEISKFAIQILLFVSVISAMVSMANIYIRFKQDEYRRAKILRKFLTFKGMIWLFVHQQLILQITTFAKAVKPTYYMSEADFSIGLPAFMILCECAIFSFLFFYSLSGYAYRSSIQVVDAESKGVKTSPDAPIGAYLAAFFVPSDIFVQTWRAMESFAGLSKGRQGFDYTGGTDIGWYQRVRDQSTSYEPYTQREDAGSQSDNL